MLINIKMKIIKVEYNYRKTHFKQFKSMHVSRLKYHIVNVIVQLKITKLYVLAVLKLLLLKFTASLYAI